MPPGKVVPSVATATRCPASTFGAPHTIVSGAAAPDVDRADRQPVCVGMRLLAHSWESSVVGGGAVSDALAISVWISHFTL